MAMAKYKTPLFTTVWRLPAGGMDSVFVVSAKSELVGLTLGSVAET